MVIPKGTTHEFWQSVHAGASKTAEELGNVEIVWQGPPREDDRTDQIKLVQNAVASGVDGIVLAPLDARALVEPVEQAIAKGIAVVIIDSALESDKISSFIATDNYHGGVLAAKRLGELLKGEGKIILLRYAVGSASTDEREKGFIDTMKAEFPEGGFRLRRPVRRGDIRPGPAEGAEPSDAVPRPVRRSFLPERVERRGDAPGARRGRLAGEAPVSGPLLSMHDVARSFGASRALDGVSLDLEAGEVLALLGENGAGKSTLMKVLSGAIRPDSGSMTLGGLPYAPKGPRDALAQGVAMIYQELTIAPHLTVEANVMLGQERTKGVFVDRRAHRRIVAEALATLDHPDIRLDARAGGLSIGAQQLIEVARALVSEARVIVFDEPTSSLTERDANRLFEVIDRLRAKGLAIVYISHFLEEVKRVAQRYVVLRDGRSVASGRLAESLLSTIIAQMVGRDLTELFPKIIRVQGELVLDLSAFSGRKLPRRADLHLHRGEVLGIAGLVGAGRTELLRAVFGLDPVKSGEVRVAGQIDTRSSPRRRIAQGVGLLSEDRKAEGLALARSIEDNLTYSALGRHARWGWLDLKGRRLDARRWMEALRVKASGPGQAIGSLSGGNQQKVALARLLHQDADVLLLDEPTRGIDVGAKAEIYRLIGEQAAKGKAVLMVSSYLPELMGICDRIAVMTRGVLSEAKPVEKWTEHAIMAQATEFNG